MADDGTEMKYCSNCKKDISASNFVMHEVHCRRHIVLCEHCREPFPKAELEQHFQDEHAKIACSKCGQPVEKMCLELHEENECLMKPQRCLYCELEFPKAKLSEHLDYCGSRTEQCPKCFQFIMLKDQLRHEENECQRRVSPTDNSHLFNNGLGNHSFDDFTHGATFSQMSFGTADDFMPRRNNFNPFVFDEMSRLLNNQGSAGPPSFVTDLSPAADFRESQSVPRQTNINMQNEITQPKRNNVDTWNARTPQQTDEDYDYLLALHLATDLDPADDTVHSHDINTFQSTSPPANNAADTNTEDMSEIQEQFWREAFPSGTANHYQEGEEDLSPQSPVEPQEFLSRQLNSDINSSRTLSAPSHPADIPIVDNLSYGAAQNWLPGDLEREGTMLPCEFCGALLPIDFIVQHQGVCDADPAIQSVLVNNTPTVTPPVSQPRRKNTNTLRKEKVPNVSVSSGPVPRSRRHQGEPVVDLLQTRRPLNDIPARERPKKNLNSNNMSDSAIGSNGVANIRAMLSKNVSSTSYATTTSGANSQGRRRLPQLGSTDARVPTTGDGFGDLYSNNSEEDSLVHVSEFEPLSVASKPLSTKAGKQLDNRAKQSAAKHDSTGRARPRPGPSRPTGRRGTEEDSIRIEGASASGSSSRQPRRSGNQVFGGQSKRTTPKRQLPDRPS